MVPRRDKGADILLRSRVASGTGHGQAHRKGTKGWGWERKAEVLFCLGSLVLCRTKGPGSSPKRLWALGIQSVLSTLHRNNTNQKFWTENHEVSTGWRGFLLAARLKTAQHSLLAVPRAFIGLVGSHSWKRTPRKYSHEEENNCWDFLSFLHTKKKITIKVLAQQ